MKFTAALLAITGASAASMSEQFEAFKAEHGKTYATEEEHALRAAIFEQNMELAARLTAEDRGTAVYGSTPFADLTAKEFLSQRANLMPRTEAAKANMTQIERRCPACDKFPELQEHFEAGTHPSSWDWTSQGAVTAVKDQGYCGSCWSFGTTGDVEGTWYLAGNSLTSLSEEQLVQCDYLQFSTGANLGCNGGLQEYAFEYLINTAPYGLVAESTYPYSAATYNGNTGSCTSSLAVASNVVARISSWEQVSSSAVQESNIYDTLYSQGPVTIGINAANMQLYRSGIADPSTCPASGVDHAVLIVGYGTESRTDYWKIKNSWATSWGEDGYYRIVAGSNACGLATDVVHSVV